MWPTPIPYTPMHQPILGPKHSGGGVTSRKSGETQSSFRSPSRITDPGSAATIRRSTSAGNLHWGFCEYDHPQDPSHGPEVCLPDKSPYSGGCVHWYSHARWQEARSEEHTSELQSLMRISYAVFCLKKQIKT